jgi:hypothetical protein
MQTIDAARTLHELDALRHQTRRRLEGLSFPLLLFGGASLVAAVVSAALGDEAQALFWSLAAPVGGVLVSLHYRRRELDLGLGREPWPYVVTAVALTIGAFVLGALEQPWSVGPWLAVAAGYLVFGWLERNAAAIGMALGLGALAVAVGAGGAEPVSVLLNAAYGVAFVVTGLLSRAGDRAP